MYTDVLGTLRRANGLHQYVAAFMENGFDCMEVVQEQLGVWESETLGVCLQVHVCFASCFGLLESGAEKVKDDEGW